MTLTYEDFKNRNINILPEEGTRSFMDKSLQDVINKTTKILGKKPNIRDIKEFLLSNLLDFLKNIKGLKNVLFSCESSEEQPVWNVVVDNDVIVFDAYNINKESKEVFTFFNYSLHLIDNEKFEASLSVSEDMKNDETVDLNTLELGIILRLLAYIIIISSVNFKY